MLIIPNHTFLLTNSTRDVVVVTVNYRLGPLGFLSLGNEQVLFHQPTVLLLLEIGAIPPSLDLDLTQ